MNILNSLMHIYLMFIFQKLFTFSNSQFPTFYPHHSAVTDNFLSLANVKSGKRKLKVYKKFVRRSYGYYAMLPEIRLSGVWLHDSGFEIGKNVTVMHKKGSIVITID